MGIAVGIDLGTVNSCVGVYKNGKVEIILNSQGNCVTPSVVAYTEKERLVGDAAKSQMNEICENTIYGKFIIINHCIEIWSCHLKWIPR